MTDSRAWRAGDNKTLPTRLYALRSAWLRGGVDTDPALLADAAARLVAVEAENAELKAGLRADRRAAVAVAKRLVEGIHAAVSFTYIDGEAARLKARIALKEAAGWSLTDGETNRLQELASAQAALPLPK